MLMKCAHGQAKRTTLGFEISVVVLAGLLERASVPRVTLP